MSGYNELKQQVQVLHKRGYIKLKRVGMYRKRVYLQPELAYDIYVSNKEIEALRDLEGSLITAEEYRYREAKKQTEGARLWR
jgi:hypothetical protein